MMTFILPLLTFRSNLATFQLPVHTECIFLVWYATPGRYFLSGFYKYKAAADKKATEAMVSFSLNNKIITLEIIRSPSWFWLTIT